MPTKIIIAGEGGQGIQTVAKIIAKAAEKSNRYSSYLPSFGVEQRGGVSIAYLQISSHPILYPRFKKADIVVAFCNRAISSLKEYITENSLFIYDNSAIENNYLAKVKERVRDYLAIPAQSLGREKYSSKVSNVIILGGIITHLKEINYQEFENALLENFADKIAKKPEIKDLNLGALKAGLDIAEKFDKNNQPFEGIEPAVINTASQNDKNKWSVAPNYCKGCGLCLVECPVKALRFSENTGFLGNPLPEVDIEKCIGCLKCMKICPDGAIRVEKIESVNSSNQNQT